MSDTSPLTGLLTIGRSEILARLFGEVVIPEAVRAELVQCHAVLPPWLRVALGKNRAEAEQLAQSVDKGEAEAIELAKELRAGWLLIDERKGRQLATKEGVPVIGLLGIVILAKRRGLVESARAINRIHHRRFEPNPDLRPDGQIAGILRQGIRYHPQCQRGFRWDGESIAPAAPVKSRAGLTADGLGKAGWDTSPIADR